MKVVIDAGDGGLLPLELFFKDTRGPLIEKWNALDTLDRESNPRQRVDE